MSPVQDPKLYVHALLEVHNKYKMMVEVAFKGDAGFLQALDKVYMHMYTIYTLYMHMYTMYIICTCKRVCVYMSCMQCACTCTQSTQCTCACTCTCIYT